MEKLLQALKNNDYRVFKIITNSKLQIVSDTELQQAQEGYRFNPVTNEEIKDWESVIGKDFYVIGFESMLGDPILSNTSEEGLPVYYIANENWESVWKVADSFDEFISNLKTIDNMINVEAQDKATIRKHVRALDNKKHTAGFYENLCFDILDKYGFFYKEYKSTKK